MTWEEYHICRYYPNCMIHTGDIQPRLLSPENVNEVRRLLAAGLSVAQISRETGVSTSSITSIKFGRTYKKVAAS